jgi:CHAD domain-containing protein
MTIEEHARIQTGLLLRRLTIQLNRAAKSCDEEAVHDLRVSIRRLNRCLRVFSEFYSEGSGKKIRRRLKTLMEGAGSVRDMDIAMEFLDEMGIGKRSPLVQRLAVSRRSARRELESEVRTWKEHALAKKWRTALGLNGAKTA